jgi:hypothetical protein
MVRTGMIVGVCALLVSSTGTLTASGARMTIVLTSGEQITGELIAARKDALLISRQVGISEDTLIADPGRITVLGRAEISKISIPGKSWIFDGIVVGLIGGVGCWGLMASDPGRPPTGLDPAGPGEKGLILFGLGGIALGVLVGATSSTRDKLVDVEVLNSLIYLQEFARYKEEEPDFLRQTNLTGVK